ncbi:MAG: hypothetical protein LBL77_00285 [Endomicrobium sp.]|nr:hypothetical protein [Endomicrobium sp.]
MLLRRYSESRRPIDKIDVTDKVIDTSKGKLKKIISLLSGIHRLENQYLNISVIFFG